MKIKIIKLHKLYVEQDIFELDEITQFEKHNKMDVIFSNKQNCWYPANEICKALSNHTSYSDIFEKL